MKILTRVLDLLYPPQCPYCQNILDNLRDPVCRSCVEKLPWLRGEQSQCKIEFAEGCVSPLRYEGMVREAILRYKFPGLAAYGKPMGVLMARCIRNHPEIQPNLITWTPLSHEHYRERGFDQAELLARSLGRELELPVEGTLVKIRNTARQSALTEKAQRKANAKGAYRVKENISLKGKYILLVDDVVTTKSTLEECARMLCVAGAEKIWCVTLAQAGKKMEKTVENSLNSRYNGMR